VLFPFLHILIQVHRNGWLFPLYFHIFVFQKMKKERKKRKKKKKEKKEKKRKKKKERKKKKKPLDLLLALKYFETVSNS